VEWSALCEDGGVAQTKKELDVGEDGDNEKLRDGNGDDDGVTNWFL
jgi:hypothetical protein